MAESAAEVLERPEIKNSIPKIEVEISLSSSPSLLQRVRDIFVFVKFRLTSLVVFSAGTGYLLGVNHSVDWKHFWLVMLGTFLVVSASNGLNEIIERNLDALMKRTENRPIPSKRMKVMNGIIFSVAMALAGIFILSYYANLLSAILALTAFALYVFVYTPFKRITPFCTFVGAFPGSIPLLIGWAAAANELTAGAWLLFFIQFLWQFPHFWSIAWVCDTDYKRAGFKMLPSNERDKRSAFQIVLYTLVLIPITILPTIFGMTGNGALYASLVAGIIFAGVALWLLRTLSMRAAFQLMFASFVYLPAVFLVMILDKI